MNKKASGKLCLICWNVLRQSGLEEEHESVGAYLKWKGTSVEWHHRFMKALALYMKEAHKIPDGKRLHCRLVFTYTKDTRSESKEETESGKV